jgi:hypothetical protein
MAKLIVEVPGGGYRFAPESPHLVPLIDDLATLYRERPVSTIHAIYKTSADNLQHFADAFRIRKKEEQ